MNVPVAPSERENGKDEAPGLKTEMWKRSAAEESGRGRQFCLLVFFCWEQPKKIEIVKVRHDSN